MLREAREHQGTKAQSYRMKAVQGYLCGTWLGPFSHVPSVTVTRAGPGEAGRVGHCTSPSAFLCLA